MLLIVDLACLVLDLGDPLRFHHMLRVFKPSSPMSLGTWCLSAYSLPLTLLVASDLFFPAAWVHTLAFVVARPTGARLGDLQGSTVQHQLAARLEGRPLAGRHTSPTRR